MMKSIYNKRFVFCTACGKLLRVEQFGDVLSIKDLQKLKRTTEKQYCFKCKLKKRDRE